MKKAMKVKLLLTLVTCLVCGHRAANAQSFYKNQRGLFSTRPDATRSLTNVKRFGPVGMGIDLIQPAFTMRISHIEKARPPQ